MASRRDAGFKGGEAVNNCLLLLEHDGENILETSTRLCAHLGHRLAAHAGIKIVAVAFGECPQETLAAVGSYGIDKVYLAAGEAGQYYSPEIRSHILANLIEKLGIDLIVLPSTLGGWELAPLLADRFEAGIANDCVEIHLPDGKVMAIVDIYNGQYQLLQELVGRINILLMADVNPGATEKLPATAEVTRLQDNLEAGGAEPALQVIEKFRLPATELDIGEADIIVGIGRAIASRADFNQMLELAGAIGAPVAGSRPAVDNGWITFDKQIGQTGRIVAPALYLTAGISGAAQHITGVERARIVAINNDPQSPILRLADLGVLGDFREIVPLLVQRLRDMKEVQA